MQTKGLSEIFLRSDANDFINLYKSLGARAESFLPAEVSDKLSVFYKLCHEEPLDPAIRAAEIDRSILDIKEMIPGYTDVALMLAPHEESKAFQYRTKRLEFIKQLNTLLDSEAIEEDARQEISNILQATDYSIGTPPVTAYDEHYLYQLLLGDEASEIRKFREAIGITDDLEETHWDFFIEVIDQMVIQSTHYATDTEVQDFLAKSELSVAFKGLNGFIKTVVSGSTETAIKLLSEEVFRAHDVRVIPFESPDALYNVLSEDIARVFIVRVENLRQIIFNERKWFQHLSRLVFVDDSEISRSSNTTLVFSMHNGIINTLKKVHNKKLGTMANSQLNLRLIIEKINKNILEKFRNLLNQKIKDYEAELEQIKQAQLSETNNPDKDIVLFKFDEFSQQIIKDKYSLIKLSDFISLILNTLDPKLRIQQNKELINEFEDRVRQYFYSGNTKINLATIVEGGGRNQIKTYGEYLLQRKLRALDVAIVNKCRTILNILPNNYQRTLNNHFHKNFGLNLFLEKYKNHLTKAENSSDNKGRFQNFLIDLGILQEYQKCTDEEKNTIKAFISDLANLDKTTITDDVQMIIRDILMHDANKLRPYILYAADASWEYMDLFPADRFDINSFDLEIGFTEEGKIDFKRLLVRLQRMKSSFQLFDESGSLWDLFCENLTIIINDPSNPSGFTNFNEMDLLEFLRFVSTTRITLFLDEAYNDSVKLPDETEPKWRTISRYIMNNINAYANISVVASLSTTKNLNGPGLRVGALAASPNRVEAIDFARKNNTGASANTFSLYILVNMLEAAQQAKKLKDLVDAKQARDASVYSFRKVMENHIKLELAAYQNRQQNSKKSAKRLSPFEGSPLHLFLLNELVAIDKLEVLRLPDDFKYKGIPFFNFYKSQLTTALNKFRVNKNFRNESNKRLKIAFEVAKEIIKDKYDDYVSVLPSDGSYLFNLVLKDITSYQGLEKFTKKLAAERGIALIPYKTGFVRISLGGYLDGSEGSYKQFRAELKNTLIIFLRYWKTYIDQRRDEKNKTLRSEEILDSLFEVRTYKEFVESVRNDFDIIRTIKHKKQNSLKIYSAMTQYNAFAQDCGVSINSIHESKNAVIEFTDQIAKCRNVREFISSLAFTRVYEYLLAEVHKKIPALKNLDFATVNAQYGKTALLKYIDNKIEYQPNNYVLDFPHKMNTMKEILLEMEQLLFSAGKFKTLAIDGSDDLHSDLAKLEGINSILRKFIQEILLHFNLPFANTGTEPTLWELLSTTLNQFTEITAIGFEALNIKQYATAYLQKFASKIRESQAPYNKTAADSLAQHLYNALFTQKYTLEEQCLLLYMMKNTSFFQNEISGRITITGELIQETFEDVTAPALAAYINSKLPVVVQQVIGELYLLRNTRIDVEQIRGEVRKISLYIIDVANKTRSTEYFDKYTHTLMRLTEVNYLQQNSAINEMVQHGITIYSKNIKSSIELDSVNEGKLSWISRIMRASGVIGAERMVQTHTRIATDAKKREYPFHRLDQTANENPENEAEKNSPNEYIKKLATRPGTQFFINRLVKYTENMDYSDYRCKIVKSGLFNELYIIHKAYIKYLADNARLLDITDVNVQELEDFIPDILLFLGAPEKVISYPKIGYFDIAGPKGNIKTLVTPLEKKADYFGDVKKPRLTMINDKVKDMGGIPVHGSLFAIEEEDGSIFTVMVGGDSGVGKSEMLAALTLKWLRKDLNRIRSIKLIAGDMFHVFPDSDGNIYGIGKEVGDFSRVTDFDPDYIKYYHTLFESAADSNVEDLNSRSTISGICTISVPYQIDIMLTASNFARSEAGIIRYDNPENFLLYRDSHGERKEKATSGDHPHIQRTLMRYPADPNIVALLDKHGNYLDDVLDWVLDPETNKYYLGSSYKLMDKIDIEEVVGQIFKGKKIDIGNTKATITEVHFDIIRNRFELTYMPDENTTKSVLLDKVIFGNLFNALASTPAGQPFISKEGQYEDKKNLLNLLNANYSKKGGKRIQLGMLSTDLGKKGREISGPQKAAEELKKLIQEVRIETPEINQNKLWVKNLVRQKYSHILKDHKASPEIDRYNYYLWQLHRNRTVEFRRFDNLQVSTDMDKFKRLNLLDKNQVFSPVLVTPGIHYELSSFTETYSQLLSLPNVKEFAFDFAQKTSQLHIPVGYSHETIVNDMVLQLMLLYGYLSLGDISKGMLAEKANREILAAAKYAVITYLEKQDAN